MERFMIACALLMGGCATREGGGGAQGVSPPPAVDTSRADELVGGLGCYAGADLWIEVSDRGLVAHAGERVEQYAFAKRDDDVILGGCRRPDAADRLLAEWSGPRGLLVINVHVRPDGTLRWYDRLPEQHDIDPRELSRLESAVRTAGFERVVIQEVESKHQLRAGTILLARYVWDDLDRVLNFSSNWDDSDTFEIVRVIRDSATPWTLGSLGDIELARWR